MNPSGSKPEAVVEGRVPAPYDKTGYRYHLAAGAESPAPGLLRRAVTLPLRGARDVVQPQSQFFVPPAYRAVGESKRRGALLGVLTGRLGSMAALLLFGWSDLRPGSARATEPPSVHPSFY